MGKVKKWYFYVNHKGSQRYIVGPRDQRAAWLFTIWHVTVYQHDIGHKNSLTVDSLCLVDRIYFGTI